MTIAYMELAVKIEMERGRTKADGYREAIKILSEYDEQKLGLLFNEFNKYNIFNMISSNDADSVAVLIDNSDLVSSMTAFVTDYRNYGISSEQIQKNTLLDSLENIPMIYFDFISETIDNLLKLPVVVSFAGLWQWEKKNEKRFRNMICVSNNLNSVVSKENLSRYKYEYLWSPNFKKAKFVFLSELDDDISADSIKKEFYNLLKNSLKGSGEKNHELVEFDEAVGKVEFKILNKTSLYYNDFVNLLKGRDYLKQDIDRIYDAVWVFTLENNNNVGFLAEIDLKSTDSDHQNKLVHGISMTFNEVESNIKVMNMLWDNTL